MNFEADRSPANSRIDRKSANKTIPRLKPFQKSLFFMAGLFPKARLNPYRTVHCLRASDGNDRESWRMDIDPTSQRNPHRVWNKVSIKNLGFFGFFQNSVCPSSFRENFYFEASKQPVREYGLS